MVGDAAGDPGFAYRYWQVAGAGSVALDCNIENFVTVNVSLTETERFIADL